jgi:hypothetical protein
MDILLTCHHCQGTVSFRPGRAGSKGRLVGRCGSCSSAFQLQGGRLTDLEVVGTAARRRWPVGAGAGAPRATEGPRAVSPPRRAS